MKKQVRRIDLRPIGCGIISRCLDESPEEANRIVAAQVVQSLATQGLIELPGAQVTATANDGHRLPVRTTAMIQAEVMAPWALAVKRETKGIWEYDRQGA